MFHEIEILCFMLSQYDFIKDTFYFNYFTGKRIYQTKLTKHNCKNFFQDVFKFAQAVMIIKFSENLKVKSFGNLIFKLDMAHRTILRYRTILRLTIQSCPLFAKVMQNLISMQTLKREIA